MTYAYVKRQTVDQWRGWHAAMMGASTTHTASAEIRAAKRRQKDLLAAHEELSAVVAAEKHRLIAARKAVMEPLRAALATHEGRKHLWLAEQIGEQTGIRLSQQTVSNYLNGYSRPSSAVLLAMCGVVGVPVSHLLSEETRPLIVQERPHLTTYRPRGKKQAVALARDGD